MPHYYSEKIYEGAETIMVAMDIGATQCAVSFAHFSPGNKPQGSMVAHWPGLGTCDGTAKIPSIVSYRDGVIKCGAEAMQDFDKHPENVAHWFKVIVYPTHFKLCLFTSRSDSLLKLRLHPASMSRIGEFEIPPLPTGVTVEQVYADLMKYLMEHTRRFFIETITNGEEIWMRLCDTIVMVLATPNGWDIREQATLRKAAIKVSLVTEENAGQLMQFVTEAEASVHYALANQEIEWLRKKTVFAVVDCGGSTVDTTVYRCISPTPLALNEVCPSECVQAGGIFVNREFRRMLEEKLKGSTFHDPETLKSMTDAFEVELKPKFDGKLEKYDLKFGALRDNDPNLGIEGGRISLSSKDIQSIFDAVINQIIKSCSSVIFKHKVQYVLLVGGFAESLYVRSALKNALIRHEMMLITIGDYLKKAAAEGALIWYIKRLVVSRAAKATFGGCVRELYNRNLHRERKHVVQLYPDGKKRVDGAFHVWTTKGTILEDTFAHILPYHVAWDAKSSEPDLVRDLGSVEIEIFAWVHGRAPKWCKDEQGKVMKGMRLICTLSADLSALAGGLRTRRGPQGKEFYRVDYNVCIYFGGTQLRAKIQWKEKEALRESQVKLIPFVA